MMRHASTHFQYSSQLPNFLQRNSSDHWEIKSALHTLAELSLIRYDDNQAFTFGIHPLLHEWARDTIPLSERKIWSVMALNTLMESLVIPGDDTNEEFDNSEFHSSILVHLEACLAVHGDPFKSLWKYLQPISLALNRVKVRNSAKCGLVLAERGFFTRATAYLQPVTEALMQGLGSSNETTEAAILGLSQVYWGLGRLDEAIKYQSQVVEVRSNSYGPEHKQTLQAMNLLGRSFWLHGMYGEALVIQRLLQDRMKSTVSLNDPLALSSKDNLGVTLGSWHQFEQSRKIHEEVLACRRELLGTTHPSTLETMSNLAMALLDLGKNIEALALMIKVFDHRQAKFGREHPWTLWAHCYLAKVKIEMGLLQEAEKMLVWGIAAGERSLDKRHLGVLMGRGQLARVYAKQGRFDEAESLTLEIIALLEPSRGIAHPDCVYALYKLGMLYDRKQDYPRAIESYGLALERADLRLTREHPLALKVEARRQRDLERLKAASEPSREERNRSTSPSLPIPEHLDQSQLKSFRHQQTW
jgi:tetratricopeptide (TPR) repeat protein